jgi:hypothetical protein
MGARDRNKDPIMNARQSYQSLRPLIDEALLRSARSGAAPRFASTQAEPAVPVPGDSSPLAVAGTSFTSATGKIRILFTIVCRQFGAVSDPGIGTLTASIAIDTVVQTGSYGKASYGFPGANPLSLPFTLTSEWVTTVAIGVIHGYQIIAENNAVGGTPTDFITVDRYTMTIEDVSP